MAVAEDFNASARRRRPASSAGRARTCSPPPSNTILTLIGSGSPTRRCPAFSPGRSSTPPGTASTATACTWEGAGACWPFITAKFSQFMYGRYPLPDRWRVDLTYVLASPVSFP